MQIPQVEQTMGGIFYQDVYLTADPMEAWILETAGEYWVAEQVSRENRVKGRLQRAEKGH